MSDIFPLENLSGTLSEKEQLNGHLSGNRVYKGPTEFNPTNDDQTIFTGGYLVMDNLLIHSISYREEDNSAGGKTAYIGGV